MALLFETVIAVFLGLFAGALFTVGDVLAGVTANIPLTNTYGWEASAAAALPVFYSQVSLWIGCSAALGSLFKEWRHSLAWGGGFALGCVPMHYLALSITIEGISRSGVVKVVPLALAIGAAFSLGAWFCRRDDSIVGRLLGAVVVVAQLVVSAIVGSGPHALDVVVAVLLVALLVVVRPARLDIVAAEGEDVLGPRPANGYSGEVSHRASGESRGRASDATPSSRADRPTRRTRDAQPSRASRSGARDATSRDAGGNRGTSRQGSASRQSSSRRDSGRQSTSRSSSRSGSSQRQSGRTTRSGSATRSQARGTRDDSRTTSRTGSSSRSASRQGRSGSSSRRTSRR